MITYHTSYFYFFVNCFNGDDINSSIFTTSWDADFTPPIITVDFPETAFNETYNFDLWINVSINELGECQEHGKIVPEKRALLNFIMDDGTDSIRSVIFSDVLEKIMSKEELENQELFAVKKKDFLGNLRKILLEYLLPRVH